MHLLIVFKTSLVGFIVGAFMITAFAPSASAITSSFDSRGPGGSDAEPGGFDFLALDLDTPLWEPVSASIKAAGAGCELRILGFCLIPEQEDDWFIFGSDTVAPGEATPGIDGGFELLASGSGNGTVDIASTETFQFIYFSGTPGFNPDPDSYDDDFRVAGFVGNLTAIPEPSALLLLGIGLIGIGAACRRRTA